MAAFLAAALATGAPTETLLGYPLTFIGLWAFGLSRHAFLLRAEQAERMLAESRRAREAETQAAALAERARMSREIHDVLAHSLAAVSVNLQAAEGLLGTLPAGSPELAKALECIGRAGVFTREGLADARRAIMALRDDAAPLADQLAALAGEYRADGDVAVDVTIGQHSRAAGRRGGGPHRGPDRAGGADQRARKRTRRASRSGSAWTSRPGRSRCGWPTGFRRGPAARWPPPARSTG